LIVACVRTGTKYPADYVYRLKIAVARNLATPHWFICLTDRPDDLEGIETRYISGLPGWFGKMALFDPGWRSGVRVLYFDLDTVICGPLDPLVSVNAEFGICENFTRIAIKKPHPCRYGSCVMTLGPRLDGRLLDEFSKDKDRLIDAAGIYGDQWIIERLYPDAVLLQYVVPNGFFRGYRDFTETKPEGCSVAVFAGKHKPHNSEFAWVKEAWARHD